MRYIRVSPPQAKKNEVHRGHPAAGEKKIEYIGVPDFMKSVTLKKQRYVRGLWGFLSVT